MDNGRADHSSGGMRFRNLRIAWSVGCGIICLIVILAWARSRHYQENFQWSLGVKLLTIESAVGTLSVCLFEPRPKANQGLFSQVHDARGIAALKHLIYEKAT